MKWDLSMFTAEIEGNTLKLDLKAKAGEIERIFKYGGKYFEIRRLLINFGYNEFKKALKLGVLTLEDFRIDSFRSFFTTLQKVESGGGLEAGTTCSQCGKHNDIGVTFCVSCGSPVDAPVAVEVPVAENRCSSCGFVAPPEARFCPGCGAQLG
jgi:hypothetical protein